MKMTRIKTALAVGLWLTGIQLNWAAAPTQRGQVAKDAAWFLTLDVDKFKTNQLGQFLLGELDKPDTKARMAAFTAIFNFDPTKKLKGATLYSRGEKPDEAVLLLHGEFDVERLLTLVKAAKEYTNQTHRTYTIHSWVDDSRGGVLGGGGGGGGPLGLGIEMPIGRGKSCAAVHPGGFLVMGQKAARVGEALDVLDGLQPSLEGTKQFPPTATATNAFLVAAANQTLLSQFATNNAVLKVFQGVAFSAAEVDDQFLLNLSLEAENEDAAKNVLAIMQGVLASATMQGDRNPAAKFLEGISTGQKDSAITASLKMPTADLLPMLKAMQGMAGRRVPPRRTPQDR
jgi:hypothetical protein